MSESLTCDTISKKQRTIIMSGLALALFASCFDGTVTSTCGPIIAAEFGEAELLPWLTTGYLLLETVMIPLSGKLSDLYGRKKLLLIGLALFGAASLVAGIAWNMWMVVIARAIQGAGGGILIPVATASVSDLYTLQERGKIQGILGALYGIGMGLGPLIGGGFASLNIISGFSGWHFAFLINLIVVAIVTSICRLEFPSITNDSKPIIDYYGCAALSTLLVLTIMYFEMLGKQFEIVSIESLACILVIIAILRLFIHIEKNAKEPVMALHIFQNPTVQSASILLFILGFAMVGDELFMGMYLQTVTGHTAVESGLFILTMVVGMITTSTIGGNLANRTGLKPWIMAGPVFMGAGFYLFSYITPEFNMPVFMLSEFLFGLGAGCLLASLMTAVQSSCDRSEVGMTTSAVNLMRNIGSTTGTAILTLIVNATIYYEALDSSNPMAIELAKHGIGILDYLGQFGAVVDEAIKQVFTDGVSLAFGFGALLLFVATIIGFRFKIVTINQTRQIKEFSEDLTKDNEQ